MTDCEACLDLPTESDVEALLAMAPAECARCTAFGGGTRFTLPDTALFVIDDPDAPAISLDAAWDLGRVELDSEMIRFTSDVTKLSVAISDVSRVRVAGMVAVVSSDRPARAMSHFGLGGYPAYAPLIALAINAARDHFTSVARQEWFAALRDSVLFLRD